MKVGDKFTVVGTMELVFKNGSTVELEKLEPDGHHLFKLIEGGCRFSRAAGPVKGAFLHRTYVQPWE